MTTRSTYHRDSAITNAIVFRQRQQQWWWWWWWWFTKSSTPCAGPPQIVMPLCWQWWQQQQHDDDDDDDLQVEVIIYHRSIISSSSVTPIVPLRSNCFTSSYFTQCLASLLLNPQVAWLLLQYSPATVIISLVLGDHSRSHVYLHNKQTRVPYDVGNKIKG